MVANSNSDFTSQEDIKETKLKKRKYGKLNTKYFPFLGLMVGSIIFVNPSLHGHYDVLNKQVF